MINIKVLWESQKPSGQIIMRTRVDEIAHLKCFAATNHITGQHIFILAIAEDVVIPELKSFRFKGVEIFVVDVERGKELNIYLLDNELKDIFSSFIQNILMEIDECITESEALSTTLNVISRWKKLFDKINFGGLTLEKQKGLIGELMFIVQMLSSNEVSNKVIGAWTSAEQDFQSKDFTFGSTGVEVKFSSSKQPRIKIANERQLDTDNLRALYLVLYSAEAVKDNGISLSSIVDKVRGMIKSSEIRDSFNLKLQLNGFFDSDREHYSRMFSVKKVFLFAVNPEFPRIITNQLPLGIFDTSYSIEISALERFSVEWDNLLSNIIL